MTEQSQRGDAVTPPYDDTPVQGTEDSVGKSASVIGAITIASRLAGFGRMLVFAWAVGIIGIGTAYQSANAIPNLIFELVAGGALAALVVPLLSGPIAKHGRDTVNRITGALLTWSLTILIPLGVIVALAARQLVNLVAESEEINDTILSIGADMLVMFAPQIPLYGVAVILTGVLQAHRRFAWPALAPLLSSITMMLVYVAYAILTGRTATPDSVGQVPILVLGLGTTLGVVVLAGCLFIPLRGLNLSLRPTWRMDAHIAAGLKALAIAGAITLGAQQICQVVLIKLANLAGDGPVVIFTLSQNFFLLPWAVLAVPLATAAYPALSEAHALDNPQRYNEVTAKTGRAIMILSGLGVSALAGLALPIATVLTTIAPGEVSDATRSFTLTLTGLSFGLIGYSLFAIYSRAMYAAGHPIRAAMATAVGWAGAIIAAIALSAVMSDADRTLALALGWSTGMTIIGIALITVLVKTSGSEALRDMPRAALTTVCASLLAITASQLVLNAWGEPENIESSLLKGLIGGVIILIVYGLTAVAFDPRDLKAALRRRTDKSPNDDPPTESNHKE
ncbi:murein biosynthesis integral membrane protein MurJ [Haloglycomyces albus]|uniref:murein biosynthesis integral membrane protein MurJ n=1 Tax=Haloglycomyces albus TaxID=526067 RepID=UPI00046D4919|nr:lipid II flippase MurJ [Haloglycomyces albus]